jgi:hypothetical protein
MTIKMMKMLMAFAVLFPAYADAPPTYPSAHYQRCVGKGQGVICAIVDRGLGMTTVRRPATKATLWTAHVAPPSILIREDGALLAEDYRPGGLVSPNDGLATILIVLRKSSGVVARVTLGDIVRSPSELPETTSHRQWSQVRFFDRDGSFVADLPDGRRLRVSSTGQKVIEPTRGGLPAFCRYAEPDPHGPCAKR